MNEGNITNLETARRRSSTVLQFVQGYSSVAFRDPFFKRHSETEVWNGFVRLHLVVDNQCSSITALPTTLEVVTQLLVGGATMGFVQRKQDSFILRVLIEEIVQLAAMSAFHGVVVGTFR